MSENYEVPREAAELPACVVDFSGKKVNGRQVLRDKGFTLKKGQKREIGDTPKISVLLPVGWELKDGPNPFTKYICDSNGSCKIRIEELTRRTVILG